MKALKEKKFKELAYTYRKEYVHWIENAKKDETREARLKKAVERISKGLKFHE